MIKAALLAATLIAPAAFEPGGLPPDTDRFAAMSIQQKRAVVRPLVSTATECIAQTVSTDPRYQTLAIAGDVNDLIVESMPSCLGPVRSMIDAYDKLFGNGAGESFFMGPYLDGLPAAVHRLMNEKR